MRGRSKVILAVLTGVASAAMTLVAGGSAQAQSAFNPIRHTRTGLCMQPESSADGARIFLRTCVRGRQDQAWLFQRLATNHYKFVNQASGLCLNVPGVAADWTPMVQGACRDITDQEFNTGARLPDVVFLESRLDGRDSGFCVEPPGNTGVGSQVFLFGCLRSIGQRWTIDG